MRKRAMSNQIRAFTVRLKNHWTLYINGEQMPGSDFANARDESESVHFAHVRDIFSLERDPFLLK